MDVGQLVDGNGNTIAAVVGAAVSIVVSVAVTGFVIVRLRPDHFCGDHRPSPSFAMRALRNVGGVLLIALGIVLSFPGVPGQGVLTILLGIMCLDVPGKRRLELWLVRKPTVHHGMNKLRARYGKPPLELPEAGPDDAASDAAAGAASAATGAAAAGEPAAASRRDSMR